MGLAHGAPSHDTFSRLFQALDPLAFNAVFRDFMAAVAEALDQAASEDGRANRRVFALDGTSLRGAVRSAGRSTPLHLVTAWVAEQRLVLAQRTARNRSEVTAAREIIALLDLRDTVVTADALHGNRATAAAILEQGGGDALIVKGNRGPLHAAAQELLQNAIPTRRPAPASPAMDAARSAAPGSGRCQTEPSATTSPACAPSPASTACAAARAATRPTRPSCTRPAKSA